MTALFPGSFDPVTLGHIDIIVRASKLFDFLIVAVMNNANKKTVFNIDERVGFVKKSIANITNAEVRVFSGLLTDFFMITKSDIIIRGLRGGAEFEHEVQYARAYKKINDCIETLYIPSNPEHSFISSGMAREAAVFGGDLHLLLPNVIIKEVNQKFSSGGL